MNMTCPRCERPTAFISRSGGKKHTRKRPADLPRNIITAVTADGTCTTCWRATKGQPRPSMRGLLGIKYPTLNRGPLTDEQIEEARLSIERFWADRRRRGIDPEGADPEVLLRA